MTPLREDLQLYTSLLAHCALGINAASTVTLELLLHGKPVINLDFDPREATFPGALGYERHIRFDHYRPVVESGAVMVARSEEDMASSLDEGLAAPECRVEARERLLSGMFGGLLDGGAGRRVAGHLDRARASEPGASGVKLVSPILLNCYSRGGSNLFWNCFLSHPRGQLSDPGDDRDLPLRPAGPDLAGRASGTDDRSAEALRPVVPAATAARSTPARRHTSTAS